VLLDTKSTKAAHRRPAASEPHLPQQAIAAQALESNTTRSLLSPLEALRIDEIRRSRMLGITGMGLVAFVLMGLPFLGLRPAQNVAMAFALAVITVLNGWLIYLSSDAMRYRPWCVGFVWITTTVMLSFDNVLLGVFSPASIVQVLGIYFISLGASFSIALGVYLASAISQFIPGIIIALELVPDPGLVHAMYRSVQTKVVGVLLVQVVMIAAFLLSRSSRRTLVRSVTEFDQAVRLMAQREALYQEAKQDLERALRLGDQGRYSGQRLGSFRLGPIIGRGAMGEVYAARHESSGEPAAVKLMQPAALADPAHVQRFHREVEAVAKLNCENVVRVLEISDATSPLPFLAMELLTGNDLAQLLRQERRLEPGPVLDLLRQVGRGISAAAAANIVHRDLKPQNIYRAEQTEQPALWKILDFGVSKLGQNSGTLTHGHVVGTPAYMAPEQAAGGEVDHRADLYALAAIAYRCLTGHLPFRGGEVANVLYRVVYEMPTRPTALLPELHSDVDAFFAIALAKDPDQRFASAEEMTRAFENALRGQLAHDYRATAAQLLAVLPWQVAKMRVAG
jgi:serine/threonine-protein kinase